MRPTTCRICQHQFHINDEKKYLWADNKYSCPKCKGIYCIMPQTERELRILQDKFFDNNRDKRYLDKITSICIPYCKSFILKRYSNKITFEGALQYYAENTVSFFIEKFLNDSDFKIEASFGRFIETIIPQAIWGKQEHDCANESLDYEFDDGHFALKEDSKMSIKEKFEEYENLYDVCKNLSELMFGIESYCESKEENFIRLYNIMLYLEGGEKSFDNFFNTYGKKGKYITQKSLEILRNELQKENN